MSLVVHGLRGTLRPGLISSAQKICRKIRFEGDMPCADCIYTVASLHAEFVHILPCDNGERQYLCEEIMSAAMDG